MMDRIIVKDLEIYAFHGVLEEEKRLGQKFYITLDLALDYFKAGEEDKLEYTVNYAKLCEEAEEFLTKNTFNLIEAAAHKLAVHILALYPAVENIKVLIKKPSAPVRKPLEYVGAEVERRWTKAYIGVGSNLGDRHRNIENAIELLGSRTSTKVTAVSQLYETKPVGYTQQGDFINCALEVKTLLGPRQLLGFLNSIEADMKRERTIRWGPRTIDLDILLFGNDLFNDEKLIIPHPRMQDRLFVLQPLCDIAPYVIHPLLGKRILEIKEDLENRT